MNNLFIPGSKITPEINFSPNGKLSMEGRSMSEDPRIFYKRIYSWIQNLAGAEEATLQVKLEYFNTSSSKLILELLNRLMVIVGQENFTIIWHYEEGDDDMFESGKYFENILDCKFQYLPYAEEYSY